jgi:hypothetical protein
LPLLKLFKKVNLNFDKQKNGFINNYEKENLNSGGQQFHHYQQNEQESLASND